MPKREIYAYLIIHYVHGGSLSYCVYIFELNIDLQILLTISLVKRQSGMKVVVYVTSPWRKMRNLVDLKLLTKTRKERHWLSAKCKCIGV